MSSVEELCDNITLINKSQNILTGRVDDIRMQYGKNRYELTFNGDASILQNQLEPMLLKCITIPIEDNRNKLLFNFKDNVKLKDIISIANENTELISIVPSMPSMDEIFIQTVKNNNK